MVLFVLDIKETQKGKRNHLHYYTISLLFATWLNDGETCLYTHNVQGTYQCKPMKLQKPMIIQTIRHDESPT